MAEDTGSNTALVVVVVILVAALVGVLIFFMGGGDDDAELEVDVGGTGLVAPAGDPLAALRPEGLRTA